MSHGVTAYRHPPAAAFWWADLKKHLTKDPDKRTTPFHPPSQSVKHTGAVYRTKVFYTVHNLLQFLITEFSPSPFPCFCLTSSRYILDFFFLYLQTSILLIPQFWLSFPFWYRASRIRTNSSATPFGMQQALPSPIPTIRGNFLHRKLWLADRGQRQFYSLEKLKLD